MDCVFCKIVSGELSSEKVYEDSEFLSIVDIQPVNKGHVLVMPKKHTPDFAEAPEEVLDRLLHVAQKVAKAVVRAVSADGFNFSTNNGRAAHQSVDHLHFHIIPRYYDDGLHPWPHQEYGQGEMAEIADKIRKELI